MKALPAPQPRHGTDPLLETPTLSMLEKYLLRQGWRLENFSAPHDGRYMTRALHPQANVWVSYPHPHYHYHGQDRSGDLRQALEDLARAGNRLGRRSTPESLALEITACLGASPPGFACLQCGQCCLRMADAWQGRVSVEEVLAWQKLGLQRILRFVQRVERPDYTLYKAWAHPITGRRLQRCPWLSRDTSGKWLCRIHAFRPLKCRSFPLHLQQAERVGCPGGHWEPEAEPESGENA